MISVEVDVFEVVMFSASTDAFLGVRNPRRIEARFLLAEENGHGFQCSS